MTVLIQHHVQWQFFCISSVEPYILPSESWELMFGIYVFLFPYEQQIEEDKKSRVESQNLVKRRKKRKSGIRVNDDLCFICGEGGELVVCDNKTCPKGYHIHCLKLKHPPQGKNHICDLNFWHLFCAFFTVFHTRLPLMFI